MTKSETEFLEEAISLLKESIYVWNTHDNGAMICMTGSECDEGGWYYPFRLDDGTIYTDQAWPSRVARFLVEVGAIEKP
jgi:hypothetical protein